MTSNKNMQQQNLQSSLWTYFLWIWIKQQEL